jgi:hypothetical protein
MQPHEIIPREICAFLTSFDCNGARKHHIPDSGISLPPALKGNSPKMLTPETKPESATTDATPAIAAVSTNGTQSKTDQTQPQSDEKATAAS